MFEWFKNLFSLEERKASTIMSVFIMFSCVGVYMIKVIGDVPINLTSIILSLAMIIGGVNSISGISDIIKMGKEKSKNTNSITNSTNPTNLQGVDSSVINTNSDSNSDSDINGNV